VIEALFDLNVEDLARLAGWAYLLIFGIAAGDAVFPVLPGETAVILGGVLAAQGNLNILVVVAMGALGAALGDSISYQLGRTANRQGRDPSDHDGRLGKALVWAHKLLEERGSSVIVTARFIPGGRTAVTFGAGYTGYSRLRFTGSVLLAGTVWGLYAGGVGYLGGKVFEEHWWAGLLLGMAIALAVTGIIEVVRKVGGKKDDEPADADAEADAGAEAGAE
jgi:membrane protein DedA with SNARE-associated domain